MHGRPDPPKAAPPVEMVNAFLDFQRATMLWKLSDLTEEQLTTPMTDSGVTLLGILKHSAYVERWWFRRVFAGADVADIWSDADPDADWRIEPGDTFASVKSLYEQETAISRAIALSSSWDDVSNMPERTHTLGWVLSHMLEEVSRHVGQIDILRESVDGLTGE